MPGHDESQAFLWASDIAEVLNLGRQSITDWRGAGAFETVEHQSRLYVAETALRDVLEWHQPVLMQSPVGDV